MITLFDQEYATEMYGYNQRKAGREEGMARGRVEGALEAMIALVKKGALKKELAAEQAGLTVEEFEKAANGLQ